MDDLDAAIVVKLRSASGYMTSLDLAHALAISRGAVAKAVSALRNRGYRIDEVPGEGYRLVSIPDVLDEREVRAVLAGLRPGRDVHVHDSIGSTNDAALSLARGGAPDGTLVVAEEQTEGRGRLGRKWCSPPGLGLWFSLVVRPELEAQRAAVASLAAALGIATALRGDWGVKAQVKWPNDIVVGARKICGVLSEAEFEGTRVRFVVLGVGLNALHDAQDFPPDIRARATSVKLESSREVRRLDLLASVMRAIEARFLALGSDGFSGMRKELLHLSSLVGKVTRVVTGDGELEGTMVDLDENGALVIRLESGHLRSVVAGEVVRVT
jgi:BirA family transcriptional regulator, biotin operon repressor / biotin---[acetyl-CoA-carboxylase] ligase